MRTLSIKQPWATLLVHGLKTVEVRSWRRSWRGRILIHAGRVPDRRPHGWELLPPLLYPEARQTGGVIGSAELVDCLVYPTREAFIADRARHLNDPSWFDGRTLYGFLFADARPEPFRPCAGNLFFFDVEEEGEKGA